MARSHVELGVAACLLALAWPGGDPPAADCASPTLLPAPEGEAPRVSCAGRGGDLRGGLPLLFGLGLDPGVAEAEALEHLPGIGPVLAAAMVETRSRQPLCRAPDLRRVHGIGPRTLERILPYLRFGGDPRCAGRLGEGGAEGLESG